MRSAEGKVGSTYLELGPWLKLKDRNSLSFSPKLHSLSWQFRQGLAVIPCFGIWHRAEEKSFSSLRGKPILQKWVLLWVLNYWQLLWEQHRQHGPWRSIIPSGECKLENFQKLEKSRERNIWETFVCKHTWGIVWRISGALWQGEEL